MKEITDKPVFVRTEGCFVKDYVKKMGRQAADGEKRFAKDTSNKGLLWKIYEEFTKVNNKKTTRFKNGPKTCNRRLTKDAQMASKHMKRCSALCVLEETQTKTAMRCHYAPVRVAETLNTEHTGAGGSAEQQELSVAAGGGGRRTAQPRVEDGSVVSYKTACVLFGIYPEELKTYVQKKHPHVVFIATSS